MPLSGQGSLDQCASLMTSSPGLLVPRLAAELSLAGNTPRPAARATAPESDGEWCERREGGI